MVLIKTRMNFIAGVVLLLAGSVSGSKEPIPNLTRAEQEAKNLETARIAAQRNLTWAFNEERTSNSTIGTLNMMLHNALIDFSVATRNLESEEQSQNAMKKGEVNWDKLPKIDNTDHSQYVLDALDKHMKELSDKTGKVLTAKIAYLTANTNVMKEKLMRFRKRVQTIKAYRLMLAVKAGYAYAAVDEKGDALKASTMNLQFDLKQTQENSEELTAGEK